MDYKHLRHTQVILDPENPRLPDGTSSDKEAINRLLDEGYDQLVALARDLAARGEANPGELPFVIKQGAKYLVLEGNRRFAALKLLSDPKLADKAEQRAAFQRIKARGAPPTTVYCAVADSRAQAEHWIRLRHTGANNGVGTKRWSAEQTATHGRRMRAPVDSGTIRSIVMADELTEAYQADHDLTAIIQRVRSSKLTNIGRFFSIDDLARLQLEIRHVPGSRVRERTLFSRHTATQLRAFFAWAMAFIEATSVDAYKNPERRRELLNDHSALIPLQSDGLPASRRLADYPFFPAGPPVATDVSDTDEIDVVPIESTSPGVSDSGRSTPEAGASVVDESARSARKRDVPDEKFLYSTVRLPNLPAPVQRVLKECRS